MNNWRTQDDLVASMTASIDELKRTIDRLTQPGDKMAESIDAQADMMETDGVDKGIVEAQRSLTRRWRAAKETAKLEPGEMMAEAADRMHQAAEALTKFFGVGGCQSIMITDENDTGDPTRDKMIEVACNFVINNMCVRELSRIFENNSWFSIPGVGNYRIREIQKYLASGPYEFTFEAERETLLPVFSVLRR